ncbi:MAG: RNase adapter RapZ, partial [Luminiphilus sp.]|nr:RNase adapter RapZ [Luminiphilus sp.]
MKLMIVTGTSGSGKSSALNKLEDLGFYCVDNLPVVLVSSLVSRLSDSIKLSHQGIAICIDIRTEDEGTGDFRDYLKELSKTIDVTVMFFDANEQTLNQRFNETRRRHPLSQGGRSLTDAIRLERILLEPLAAAADLFIDTSEMTPYEQRQFIQERVTASQASRMSILVKSFGFKKGAPVDADIMFDMRMLPNPHWDPSLRPRTGQDK